MFRIGSYQIHTRQDVILPLEKFVAATHNALQ